MSRNTIKNPSGGLVLKVAGFDELKKVWKKYKPNSVISDFELNEFMSREINKDSKFNLEDYLKLEINAWEDFKRRYPYANKKTFSGEYHNKSFNIYYKHTPIEVIGDNPATTFYDNVKKALEPPGSFPFTLLSTNSKYPIPGTPFNKKPAPILNEFEISVSETESFPVKFRNIFKETTITFNSAQQSRSWLHGPNINYWPQQLNFAVWCATSGCGISLNEKYPERIQQFINFHVYFTIRRILYELRISLPDDSIFQQIGNHHNAVAFQRLCQEFNLPNNPDFRYKGGKNHGLGTIFIRDHGNGRWVDPTSPALDLWPNPHNIPIFHDEHGIGGHVGKIVNISHGGKQYEWFSPYLGKGLTKPGMGRLNRSVEAFVYCIVGAEVNVRNSIVDTGGGGQETQQEMLKLFEEAVLEEDIAKSVQRYQLVIQEAKLRLDYAIAPSIWLIPSNLIINTESVIGYNNNLLKANDEMTFGLNELLNDAMKQVGLNHNLGTGAVSLPHIQNHDKVESSKILKNDKVERSKTLKNDKVERSKTLKNDKVESSKTFKNDKVEKNWEPNSHVLIKTMLIILVAGVGYWLF